MTCVIALKLLLILLVRGPFRETFRARQFGTTYHLLAVNVANSEDVRLPSIFLECSENLSCCHIRNAVLSEGGVATSSFKRFSTLTTVSEVRGEENYHGSEFNWAGGRFCRLGRGNVRLGVGFMGCIEGLCTFAHDEGRGTLAC